MATAVQQTIVPTYIIPLQKSKLLLPATAVAEIIPYEPLQRSEDAPHWFVGILSWRGVQIPVVSFEMLSVERGSFSLVSVASASLVVVRTVATREEIPFYAIVAQAVPELIQLDEELIIDVGEDLLNTELAKARMKEVAVSIPDLEYIEASINKIDLFE